MRGEEASVKISSQYSLGKRLFFLGFLGVRITGFLCILGFRFGILLSIFLWVVRNLRSRSAVMAHVQQP